MKTKVAAVQDLEEGRGFCTKADGQALVLVKRDGSVYAVENRCPHLGVALGGKVEGDQIVCRFHGSRFDVRTGENTDWIAAVAGVRIPDWSRSLLAFGRKPQPIRTFPVTIEGGEVYVEVRA